MQNKIPMYEKYKYTCINKEEKNEKVNCQRIMCMHDDIFTYRM